MKPRKKKTAAKTAARRIPKHGGGALLTGGAPGNKGGGRKPDVFKAALADVRDTSGMALLREILGGEVTYTLNAKCAHCGKVSKGGPKTFAQLLKLVPSPSDRLRGADLTMRYTVGLEKTVNVKIAAPADFERAFGIVRDVIAAECVPAIAERITTMIQERFAKDKELTHDR